MNAVEDTDGVLLATLRLYLKRLSSFESTHGGQGVKQASLVVYKVVLGQT